MGRHALRITILLGILITLVGGTGIFATFTDRATAGQNDVTTGSRPRAADLKIATEDPSQLPAGTPLCPPATTMYFDDTNTAQLNAGSLQPGQNLQLAIVCLWNQGSGDLDITASAIDLLDADIDCTGDEAAAGDTTCGLDQTTQQPQAGELSPLLLIDIDRVDCADIGTVLEDNASQTLDQYNDEPVRMGPGAAVPPLAPNEYACLMVRGSYPTPAEAVAQRAQSDQVTWKFAFDATAR
jgi:predicted ribosomally synthesized peptide with SipW-like signal peptide